MVEKGPDHYWVEKGYVKATLFVGFHSTFEILSGHERKNSA